MKNLSLKLTALLIALMLFYFVNNDNNHSEITLSLPVQFSNLPENKFIISPEDRRATVSFRGPSYVLSNIATDNKSFNIKLPENVTDNFRVDLSAENLDLPQNVSAYNIRPSSLDLILVNIVTRQLPVQVPRIGKLSSSYKLINVDVEPSTVSVTGPENIVESLAMLETEHLDLRTMNKSGQKKLTVRNPSSRLTLTNSDVTVNFDIASLNIEKEFKNHPVELRSTVKQSYKMSQNQVNIEVTGPHNIVKDLQPDDVIAYVNIKKDSTTKIERKVRVQLPKEIEIIKLYPENIILEPVLPVVEE